ncbi:MAG: Iron-sulfur cluster assembly scaffold protein IscU 2 [Candidatus Methanocomedens sp.]|nr:MAG: Iron-sulfur cluster assembly scaffold protein IscU 2 [ANME-2 cluster archaeon]
MSIEYSEKVKDHFRNPRNVGTIKDADATGRVGNPVCGDMMEIQLKVEDNIIKDIKFKTFGCASAIATSSMITEIAMGKTLEEALEITRQDVADELGGLPPVKMHCSNLAADALHAAIKDYKEKQEKGIAKLGENGYEVAVIGGGAAGLATAAMSSYVGLKTVIFDGGQWGGLLNKLCPDKLIENYPGLTDKMTTRELTQSLMDDASGQDSEMVNEYVNDIEIDGDFKILTTDSGTYKARMLVLASGSSPAKSDIAGVEKFASNDGGVYYLTTDPSKLADKRVLVYGRGYNAMSTAGCIGGIADNITLVTDEASFMVSEREMDRVQCIEGLKMLTSTILMEVQGGTKVEKTVLEDQTEGEKLEIVVDAVVLATEMVPNIGLMEKLGVEKDESGFVKTDKYQRTSLDGVYAIGNVASDIDLLVVAEAQGTIVAHDAYRRLRGK